MKILMFSPLFYPHIGGVENTYVYQKNDTQGNEVTIITRKYTQKLKILKHIIKLDI